MSIKQNLIRFGAAASALFMTASLGLSAFAADYGTATNDTIDTTRKGSITIYKYDETAMAESGITVSQFHANGEQDKTAQNTLTDFAINGVIFSGYRVGDVKTYTTGSEVQVEYGISNADLMSALNLKKSEAQESSGSTYYFTSTQYNDALASALEQNTSTKNKLEGFLYNHKSDSSYIEFAETGATGVDGMTSLGNLSVGLYLIVETYVPEDVEFTVNPYFVSIPFTDEDGLGWLYDAYTYPKNLTDHPTLDKTVADHDDVTQYGKTKFDDTATASEGDPVDYRLTSKLPKITSTASYLTKYTYEDHLSKGLTYNKDVKIAWYSKKSDAENNTTSKAIAVWDANSGYFTTRYATNSDKSSTLTVEMTADGLKQINPNYSEKYMVVFYSCTVNTDAEKLVVLGDNGNPNDVKLTYSRTNTKFEDHLKDEAEVYVYGLNLTKRFSDAKGDFTKVKFVLKNTTDGYYVAAKSSVAGKYDITGKTDFAGATIFSPDSTGSLIINGMEANTYSLTEIETDDGYSLLKDSIKIEISGTETSILASKATIRGIANQFADVQTSLDASASAKIDNLKASMSAQGNSQNARVDLGITNNKDFELPHTGGMGTMIATVGGLLAMACGAMVLLLMKRKSK